MAVATPPRRGRLGLTGIARALTPREWLRVGGMVAFIVALHLVGWLTLIFAVAPQHLNLDHQVFGVGIGVTAYTLGMRHAFDADHISAIDNTTRKLLAEGKRPLSVGFWFSLGHSTIVFVAACVLAGGARIAHSITDDGSTLHQVTGTIGASVSGLFLYLLAALNVVILVGILKIFREMRRGRYDEVSLEEHLANRGLLNRFFGKAMRSVRSERQMYPIGVLFGLGFDTATEVALLVLAGSGAASGLPWYSIVILPVLFAAGMCLFDTIDGTFMNFAYDWAFARPVRKVFYNLTITGLSIAVAFLIGTIELIGVLHDQAHVVNPVTTWVADLDLNYVGYGIVGLFALVWAVAVAIWHLGKVEDKWSRGLADQVTTD
ncbi:MAG TPA: HoxN/HupN/NixA family nickel/cobalt transporter [Mycobacteriales bacterium]|nr:HoxN/HupN/NixA family nickel/cobalt transporter [Mycobacteriales bacterium]